jgi:GT2 family glycosyltransferase
VRREPFLAVGGFDERFGVGGEEQPLALDLAAAGWGLCYVDEVVAVHHPSPSRDRRARLQRVVRNDLWLAWSRRRAPSAVGATVSAVAAASRDGVARAGLVEAVGGAVGVFRRRRPIPARLEQQMRLLERSRCRPVAAS